MTTRQAVWPPDLIERRRVASRLEAQIRGLSRQANADNGHKVAYLRA